MYNGRVDRLLQETNELVAIMVSSRKSADLSSIDGRAETNQESKIAYPK